MEFRNDLDMWHQFRDFAETLSILSKFHEHQLIHECVDYAFDSGASEERCSNPKKMRKGDFDSLEECWKCPFYSKYIKDRKRE